MTYPNDTHEHDDDLGADILARFDRFSGGITVTAPQMRDVEHVVTTLSTQVEVPSVNGALPGPVAGVDFWVGLHQLQLAPKEDLLCSRYDPNDDPDFDRFKNALALVGDQIPSLPVLPANRDIVTTGGAEPVFLVYDQPEVYFALIALKRARARAHIPPVQTPGAILLNALARHGQLRREPSTMEVCEACKRLKEVYDYTLQEIAQMQSRDPEDNTPPSITQVHYQILVAGLPLAVKDMLHKRHILWSHARKIAEYCGDDAGLCEQLATIVAQSGRMSVEGLGFLINRLRDGHSRLETDTDGVVHVVPIGRQLGAVSANTASPAARATVFYQRMMVAPPAQVRRVAAGFQVSLVPADARERIAITAQSLDGLREWLNQRRSSVPVRELEATLLGYLEALRSAGMRQGLINRDGALMPVIDAREVDAADMG